MEITVSGYTDSIGEGDYNVELSQDRARAVGIHLQSAGVTASKFDIRGLGEIAGCPEQGTEPEGGSAGQNPGVGTGGVDGEITRN